MGQSKQEYLAGYARLAPYLATRARVVTPSGLGNLTILDVDQDSGYGVGVRVDYIDGRGNCVLAKYSTDAVRPLDDYAETLLQIYTSTTWDGDLISKSHRDTLAFLKLVRQYRGLNMITVEGIDELIGNEWISKDGIIIKPRN